MENLLQNVKLKLMQYLQYTSVFLKHLLMFRMRRNFHTLNLKKSLINSKWISYLTGVCNEITERHFSIKFILHLFTVVFSLLTLPNNLNFYWKTCFNPGKFSNKAMYNIFEKSLKPSIIVPHSRRKLNTTPIGMFK